MKRKAKYSHSLLGHSTKKKNSVESSALTAREIPADAINIYRNAVSFTPIEIKKLRRYASKGQKICNPGIHLLLVYHQIFVPEIFT